MKFKELDVKAKNIARRYQACEKELLAIVIELDCTKAFHYWGYPSLFAYATKGLGLSAAVTLNFTAVARKSRDVPELKNQVLAGKISIHQARKITPVLNKENQNLWIEKAKNQTQKQLERDVALESPKTAVMESSKYVSSDTEVRENVKILQKVPRVQLQMGVSEATMIRLRRVQDLESQRKKGNSSLEDTLNALLETYLQKNDPVEKAKRQKIRGRLQQDEQPKKSAHYLSETYELQEKTEQVVSCKSQISNAKAPKTPKRKPIPAKVRHQVQLRDGGRCTHKDSKGHRCSSHRYLEIHHLKEVAQGGDNTFANLTTLCSGHHKAHHLKRHSP